MLYVYMYNIIYNQRPDIRHTLVPTSPPWCEVLCWGPGPGPIWLIGPGSWPIWTDWTRAQGAFGFLGPGTWAHFDAWALVPANCDALVLSPFGFNLIEQGFKFETHLLLLIQTPISQLSKSPSIHVALVFIPNRMMPPEGAWKLEYIHIYIYI